VNPYRPGAGDVPPVVAGRELELIELHGRLGTAASYGHFPGPPLLFAAPRGLGKTTLLQLARRDAEQGGFVTAFAAADPDTSLLIVLAQSIAEAAATAGLARGDRWSRWRERLAALSVEVSLTGGVKLAAAMNQPAPEQPPDRVAFTRLLGETATLARQEDRPGLAILVDELQEAREQDLRAFAYAAQELAGSPDRPPVVIVGAGLPSLPDRLIAAASFAERFTYAELRILSPAAAAEALIRPAEALRVTWTREAADAVLDAARGYPYLLQLFGSTSWSAANPAGPGATIALAHAQQGLDIGRQDLGRGMFRGRWAKATPAERQFLIALATLGEGPARIADVARHLDRQVKDLSMVRAGLIDKGVIQAPGRGQIEFTIAGFGDFVQAQALADDSD